MKKTVLKLLGLVLLFFITGGSTINATNVITSGNRYYIQNVESGLFLCGANNWGTRATVATEGVEYILTSSNGAYTIQSSLSSGNQKHLGTNLYNDADPADWTIAAVDGEEGVFTIYNTSAGGYLSQGSEQLFKGYAAVATETASNASRWYILTYDEAVAQLADATADNPMTASFLIKNPGFNRYASTDAWATTGGVNKSGGSDQNRCAEAWRQTFSFTQTFNNIPNGVYGLTAQGFYRNETSTTSEPPYIFINDQKQYFPERTGSENSMGDASNSFSNGQYRINEVRVTVTNGTLSVGARCDNNTKWAIFDNFDLTYYGVDLDEAIAAVKAQAQSAAALLNQVQYSGTKTALQTAIDNVTNMDEESATVSSVEALASALETAVSNSNNSIADYANLLAAIGRANNYMVVDPEYTALGTAITTAQGIYDGKATESCANAINAITTALQDANVHDYAFIQTKYTAAANLGEWVNTFTGSLNNEGYDNSGTYYFDEWSGSPDNPSISQTVTLPAGEYVIVAAGRGQRESTENVSVKIGDNDPIVVDIFCKGNRGVGIDTSGAANFSSTGTYTADGQGMGWEYRYIPFTLTATTQVTLGSTAHVNNSWASLYEPMVLTTEASIKALRLIEIQTALMEAPDGKMSNEARNELGNCINVANNIGNGDACTLEQLNEILADLQAAIAQANASIADYTKTKAAIDKYGELAEELDGDGEGTYLDAVTDIIDDYDSGDMTSDQSAVIEAAYIAAVKAQTTNGADMTGAIVNPSFETGNLTGWTVGSSDDTGVKPNSNGTYTANPCDGDYLFNTWQAGLPLTQTITGLQNGSYVLKAVVASSDGRKIFLTANGGHNEGTVCNSQTEFIEAEYGFTVTDGTATIGAVGGAQDGTFTADGGAWYKVDNFRLYYYKLDIAALNEAKANAQAATALLDEPQSTTTHDALQGAITAINAINAETATQAAAETAIAALTEAIANAESSIKDYAAVAHMIALIDALNDAELVDVDISAYTAAYSNGTLADDALENLRYIHIFALNNLVQDGTDMTSSIVNPTFESGDTGWTTTSAGGGWGGLDNGDEGVKFAQFWHKSFTVSQTVTGIPNGTYLLTAQGGYNFDTSDRRVPSISANGQSGDFYRCEHGEYGDIVPTSVEAGYYVISVPANVYDGTLKIEVSNANEGVWTFFDNFMLTYVNDEYVDMSLVQIPEEGNTELCTVDTSNPDYTEYTIGENPEVTVAFKMTNIDVEGCDYVIVKFAEPIATEGWKLAFWGVQDINAVVSVPVGTKEYKYILPEEVLTSGVLPEITLLSLWTGNLDAKVTGVYKHLAKGIRLTSDMYHEWSSDVSVNAEITNMSPGCSYSINEASAAANTAYGNGTMDRKTYADLTPYQYMVVNFTGTDNPRIFFNGESGNGNAGRITVNASSQYVTNKGNGKWIVDLAAITANMGYAHLQSIKASAYNTETTVTDVFLYQGVNDVEISEVGYATMYLTYPVAIPAGVTASTASIVGNQAVLTPITTGIIPANTGVVLQAEAGTYQFVQSLPAAAIEDNMLVGYDRNTDITGSESVAYYALNYKTVDGEKVAGFFAPKGTNNNPHGNFTAVAYKAYLMVEGNQEIKEFLFDFNGEPDAIKNVNVNKNVNGLIYNIAGQVVDENYKGIVIKNGKKYINK